MNNGDGSRVLNIESEDPVAVINVSVVGLTLTGGDSNSAGGGILAIGHLDLRQCVITANSAAGAGGGVSFGAIDGSSDLTIEDCVVSFNSVSGTYSRGGGIYIYGPYADDDFKALVRNSQILSNQSSGTWSWGGALHVEANGLIQVQDNLIKNNKSSGTWAWGGGIAMEVGGNAVVSGCTISENVATGTWSTGGGTFISDSSSGGNLVQIKDNDFSNNAASGNYVAGTAIALESNGIGLELIGNQVTRNMASNTFVNGVVHVELSANSKLTFLRGQILANIFGNGLHIVGVPSTAPIVRDSTIARNVGYGISSQSPILVENSTISGNRLSGIRLLGGNQVSEVVNSTVTSNQGTGIYTSSNVILTNSIVAGNRSADIARDSGRRPPEEVNVFATHSLIGNCIGSRLVEAPVGLPDANGNLIGGPVHGVIDPMLGPLADNGGFELPDGSHILTHALLPGSPAINAGDLNAVAGQNGVPEFDQRGEPFGRMVGGRIDIGAFEFQTPTDLNLLVDTLADESDGDYSRGDLSLREAIELANAANYRRRHRHDPLRPGPHAGGPATILLDARRVKDHGRSFDHWARRGSLDHRRQRQ